MLLVMDLFKRLTRYVDVSCIGNDELTSGHVIGQSPERELAQGNADRPRREGSTHTSTITLNSDVLRYTNDDCSAAAVGRYLRYLHDHVAEARIVRVIRTMIQF